MATLKPISTISYNSEAFLREKLDVWVSSHIIQSYQYICHKGEDGDKDHIHLRIEPNKKLDVMDLTEELHEYVKGNDKPLGVRPWRPSKEEDWILYVVHDRDYLSTKYIDDKKEKIPYQWQDIKANEYYDVEAEYVRAKSKLAHTSTNLASRISDGEAPINLIKEGENPFMVNQIARAIYSSDYAQVLEDYKDLEVKYRNLQSQLIHIGKSLHAFGEAIDDIGLKVDYVDEEHIRLYNPSSETSIHSTISGFIPADDIPF